MRVPLLDALPSLFSLADFSRSGRAFTQLLCTLRLFAQAKAGARAPTISFPSISGVFLPRAVQKGCFRE